jgi:serine/threonine protein kinase
MRLVIGDMGLSKNINIGSISNRNAGTFAGTLNYMSPEMRMIALGDTETKYSYNTDVWYIMFLSYYSNYYKYL